MTKREFMEKLTRELENRRVADAEDIIEEYRQHFEFKLADGYSQEEIAAKLGDPAALAAQFAESGEGKSAGAGSRILVRVGLGFVNLLEGMIFLMLLAFGLVLTAATAAFSVSGVCLAVGSGMFEPVAPMPYGAALLLGLALLALSVLTAHRLHLVWRVPSAIGVHVLPFPQQRHRPGGRPRRASCGVPAPPAFGRKSPSSA